MDPEFELHPLVSVWQRTYLGHAGIESWRQDLAELWDEFQLARRGPRPRRADAGGPDAVARAPDRGALRSGGTGRRGRAIPCRQGDSRRLSRRPRRRLQGGGVVLIPTAARRSADREAPSSRQGRQSLRDPPQANRAAAAIPMPSAVAITCPSAASAAGCPSACARGRRGR